MARRPPATGPCDWITPLSGEPPARPLLLFDPPQRLDVLAALPDSPPRRFVARAGYSRGPRRRAGTHRRRMVAPPRWPCRTAAPRDYYRVEDESGARFWLFRSGLAGADGAPPPWYLHGIFA
jgi:protein ImuB